MSFATNHAIPGQLALILTPATLGRLAGGFRRQVGPDRDFVFINIGQSARQVMESVMRLAPCGLIMEHREDLVEPLASLGKPLVLVLADLLADGMGCVNVDDHALGRQAAEYLAGKGLKQFGVPGLDKPHAPERKTGFIDWLTARDHPVDVLEIESGGLDPARHRQFREGLEGWLQRLPKPVGIFVEQGSLGREVLAACQRTGFNVPGDVAILAASDDEHTCELSYPQISSMEIPWEEIGYQAVLLLDRIREGVDPGDPVLIPPGGIRTRGSTDFYGLSDERVQRAVTHMRDHFREAIDIAAVARATGVNRRTLERLFRDELGRTPAQVLAEIRVRHARELLEYSSLRIGEIADSCGYSTSEQLAKAFRSRFKQTPRAWRKSRPVPAEKGAHPGGASG